MILKSSNIMIGGESDTPKIMYVSPKKSETKSESLLVKLDKLYTKIAKKYDELIEKAIKKSPFFKALYDLPVMGKITLTIMLILMCMISAFVVKTKQEGFTHGDASNFILKEGDNVYDDFYASVYDELKYNDEKSSYEVGELVRQTQADKKSVIMEVGSGTGSHINILNKYGYNAFGLEISPAMINEAKSKYPDSLFMQGDALDTMLLPEEKLTHILCMNYTIYLIKDKRTFFQNCMKWLMNGGHLAIHMVNRERFDPTLDIVVGKPLKIFPERSDFETPVDKDGKPIQNTTTSIKFKKYDYKRKFDIVSDKIAHCKERFINTQNNQVRQHNHVYYMDAQRDILDMASEAGFIVSSQIELNKVGCRYQYIYILQKPT